MVIGAVDPIEIRGPGIIPGVPPQLRREQMTEDEFMSEARCAYYALRDGAQTNRLEMFDHAEAGVVKLLREVAKGRSRAEDAKRSQR